MKKTSVKKIREVMKILGDNSEGKRLLSEVLISEEMEKDFSKKKFNPYNYVSGDIFRPALSGVYHDNGSIVATDAHILIVMKSDYPKELEGKIVAKDGCTIEGRFPNYKAVIPYPSDDDTDHRFHTINRAAFEEAVKKARNDYYVTYGTKKRWTKGSDAWLAQIGCCALKCERLSMMLDYMDKTGATQIETFSSHKAVKTESPDGSVCLVMPIIIDDYDKNRIIYKQQ